MATFVMDMAFDTDGTGEETLPGVIAHVERTWGVTAKVLQEHGPGGGWPEMEFSGSPEQLERLAREFYSMDDEDVRYFLGD